MQRQKSASRSSGTSLTSSGGGRRQPPLHGRWPKGRSGNPQGRRKGSRNKKTLLRDLKVELLNAVNERVTINDNGQPRTMTKREAILKTLVDKAMYGDGQAMRQLFQLLQAFEANAQDQTDQAAHTVVFVTGNEGKY
jgi:hypothetical protein